MRWIPVALLAVAACGPSVAGDDDDDDIDASATVDADNDGYPESQDCDDGNASINPSAPEDCDDGVDNNCNGQADTDLICLDPCLAAEAQESYFGCEFYAVDLPQFNTDKIYAVLVSNPSTDTSATVTVATEVGQIASFQVMPRSVYTWQVQPRPRNVPGAGISMLAYKVVSDRPVALYQFNSLDTISAASTDATLIFAKHSLAKLYYAMDYQSIGANDGFISVMATEADTQVNIAPTTAVTGATTATLQPFQVMTVMGTTGNTSLTGSQVSADKPIAVFGGNRCTNVPYGMPYCDHIEHQIFPRQAMGMRYIVGKLAPRTTCNPPDYIRVLSDADGAVVTLDPPVAGPFNLDAGQWQEFSITGSVEIQSTQPIMVGQFMRSSNASECSDEGDPAFIMQVPAEQYRKDYVFLTPPTYTTDRVDVVAPVGANVTLDGAPLALSATPIGATGHTLTTTVIQDGQHVILSNQPVSVIVYGYGGPPPVPDDFMQARNVSYGYAAGMNLSPINPVE